jgi:cytochrome b involved in lipid metabolism
MTGSIAVEEISKHNSLRDLWIVVDGMVYDMTDFAPEHPGGVESVYPFLSTEIHVNDYTQSSSALQAATQPPPTPKSTLRL